MTEGGFYQPKKMSPQAVGMVILLHGAVLAALMTARMDVMKHKYIITTVDPIPVPPPPPPKPTSQPKPKTPQQPDNNHPTPPPIPFPPPAPPQTGPSFPPSPPLPPLPPGTGTSPEPPLPPPPSPPHKIEAARARADLSSYVSNADYPDGALRNNEQGTTRFRLSVGSDGRVTGCTVLGSSGSSALDSATCRLMKNRARFTPARDSSGKPTVDSVASAIRWVLPDG
jgi:protein TonB